MYEPEIDQQRSKQNGRQVLLQRKKTMKVFPRKKQVASVFRFFINFSRTAGDDTKVPTGGGGPGDSGSGATGR